MIYLAIITPTGDEYHINFPGHATVEAAKKEIETMRQLMIRQDKSPYDYYIYEAAAPYTGVSYNVDDIDMNFYEEKDAKQVKKEKLEGDAFLGKVAELARLEEEKYGKLPKK
jgi:hypothetical protein